MGVLAATAAVGAADLGTEEQRAAGQVLYDKYCTQCHGDLGDGLGVAAGRVKPAPRDFTGGKYKIRETPSGALPTTDDIKNIIRRGVPYTSMPAWPQLSDGELTELAYYLKSFSDRFTDDTEVATPMNLPKAPAYSDESRDLGEKLYAEIGCPQCHGELARGDGWSGPTLKDDWGDHIRPADLTKRWTFRGGPTREDIFRAYTTALNGTPMPTYADSLTDEERWNLADYVWSLSPSDEPPYADVLVAHNTSRAIDLDDPEALDALFEGVESAYFPVVGQIMEPGREFYPSATDVRARAVYNDAEIVIELRWNDMRAETTGSNAPDLEVPRYEDDPMRGAAAPADGGAASDDPFAAAEADPFAAAEADPFAAGAAATAGVADPSTAEFSDAVAIQFPSTSPTGLAKPYFLFGDAQTPVDLWFQDLAQPRARRYVARGSTNLEPQAGGYLQTVHGYDRGEWRVVFKRDLRDGGVPFEPGTFLPVAFSVWDGFNRERGNKRGLTRWFSLYTAPPVVEVSKAGPVGKAIGVTLLLELIVIFLVRRRYRAGAID